VTLVAVFLTTAAVAIAAFVNFHDFSGYAHGLADGDNNNGFVRDYIHRDSGNNGWLFTQRYQSGNPLGSDSCTCVTLDRSIFPSINECHESVDVLASSPALSEHIHYHANYCG
jgi:hypothetical protein